MEEILSINIIDDEHSEELEETVLGNVDYYSIKDYHINSFDQKPDNEKLIEITNSKINAFIVDLDLGRGINEGLLLIENIRNIKLNSLIIVWTANADNTKIKNRCEKAGADIILNKKFFGIEQVVKATLAFISYYTTQKIKPEYSLPKEYITQKSYITQVVEFNKDKVLLAVKKSKESREEKRLWFDIDRIDNPKILKNDFSYIMKDEIVDHGISILRFERIEDNYLVDDDELEKAFKVIDESKNAFQ